MEMKNIHLDGYGSVFIFFSFFLCLTLIEQSKNLDFLDSDFRLFRFLCHGYTDYFLLYFCFFFVSCSYFCLLTGDFFCINVFVSSFRFSFSFYFCVVNGNDFVRWFNMHV